ncbi:Oligosaccharide biosynthesis protein Alg14 like family protein [Clavispora lusitaniae]|uniref:Oligosaccharide biosynthesis protein Alg14 like family protein n=1 Tax=Clavispora lusitaniae TaxID=36911 RepID=UPI00202BCB6B|nr:Oligosaccharide biosynthesis protein Alg14 like family protein [Clavispora lusitaniae]
MPEFSVLWLLLAALLPAFLLSLRLLYVLPCFRSAADNSKKSLKGSIMVLLGSGGHTGEMLRMLAPVPLGNCSRTWIVSSGDTTSLEKARAYEEKLETLDGKSSSTFVQLPRARRVGESPLSSVVSTVVSIAATAQKIWVLGPPDVLLVNGPGTSVVLAYVLFAMKFLGLGRTRIVYIESLARVKSLSLSGRLIFPIADRFVVQWKELALRYHRAEYHGILV